MDDLASKLNSILNSKEGQEQLKHISEILNKSNVTENNNANTQQQNTNTNNKGFDFSALNALFNNSTNQNNQQNSQQQNSQQQNNQANQNNNFEEPSKPQNNSGFDFSSLSSLFNSGNNNSDNDTQETDTGLPNIDMNMLLKVQQMMSSMSTNDKNTQLLVALKPHFKEHRQKKVDQALSMLRLFSMLPMLKESGIFGNF